jgi:hypothetical protein
VTTYFFVDDIQFPSIVAGGAIPTDKVFGFAGYVIEADGLDRLMAALSKAKSDEGLRQVDPVKHSVDQRTGKVYLRNYGRRDASSKFDTAKLRAFDISRVTLKALPSCGGRVLASVCWPFSRSAARPDLTQWAFENLLQRFGWMIQGEGRASSSVVIVVDRPESDPMYESFVDGVYHGRTTGGTDYHSGPLGGLGVVPTLMFSSTPHSPPLQVADYVARACRDFISWCHDGRKPPALFVSIVPSLHHNPSGVDRVGFVITPDPGFTVDEKIAALLRDAGVAGTGSA